jgi:hypothetical protein
MRPAFALALLALASPVAAQGDAPLTVARLWALPPDRIGDIVLPPGHASIARVQFGSPGPPLAATQWLILFTAATPLGADFCLQDAIEANVTPIPNDSKAVLDKLPALIGSPTYVAQYRYRRRGEQCDGARAFFTIDGMSAERGLAAFRMLRRAIALAKSAGSRGSLPFAATSSDYLPRLATSTAAGMLAAADLGSVLSVSRPSADSPREHGAIGKQASARGWQFFEVEIGESGGMDRATISFATAQGRIVRLAIDRSSIVY